MNFVNIGIFVFLPYLWIPPRGGMHEYILTYIRAIVNSYPDFF